MLTQLKKDLERHATKKRAEAAKWYFKTGPGEYGEGDVFIGVTLPDQRKVAKKYKDLDLKDIQKLLNSKIHEHRLVALIILVDQYKENEKDPSTGSGTKRIFDLYLRNTKNINNWDLVDTSAHKIVGRYLLDKDRKVLYKLARSKNLWERRIAMISTFAFIRNEQFQDTFKIAEMLLDDTHDLIHKAVGWGLREVGNIDRGAEEQFLKKHYKTMPRTMLRYAIEKFPEKKRRYYLGR